MPFGSAFFTLVAVATCAYLGYRYLATQPGAGAVTAIRPYCELVTCNWGKCNSRKRMPCTEVPERLESNQHVRRFQQARIEFVGRDGHSRAAWADFGKLPKGHAKVGDRVALHFIDGFGDEPEVTQKPSLFLSLFGMAAFLFFLSIGARMHRQKWEGR